MWQQIQLNKRKSLFLIILMAIILVLVGASIAILFEGISIAVGIWLIMLLVSYFQGDKIVLSISYAVKISETDNPKLYNIVEEMTIASGLPKIPEIYIVDEKAPAAFKGKIINCPHCKNEIGF